MEPLSTRQLAEIVGVSESSIKRWVDRGRIAATRTPGGHRRIALPDALKFIQEEGLSASGYLANMAVETADATWEGLRDALLRGDLGGTQALLIGRWLAGWPVARIWDDLVVPAMRDIGTQWEKGPQGIAVEHVATVVVQQVTSQLWTLVEATRGGQRLAIGCAPELDPYTLPSLAVSTVLSEASWRPLNLGPMTPIAALRNQVTAHEPQLVWVCFARDMRSDEIDQWVEDILEISDGLLLVGGRGIPSDWSSGADRCLHKRSMTELAEVLEQMESTRAKLRGRRLEEP